MSTWTEVEREAREQVSMDIAAAEATPLVVGQVIAWSECSCGRTSAISAVHRVAVAGREPKTYCGDLIPPAVRRFPLNPRLEWSMPRCKYCAVAYSQLGTRDEAPALTAPLPNDTSAQVVAGVYLRRTSAIMALASLDDGETAPEQQDSITTADRPASGTAKKRAAANNGALVSAFRGEHGKERFTAAWWEKRTMPEPNTGCHFWLGSVCALGYGRVWKDGKGGILIHRIAYEQFVGPVPEGFSVCHRCDCPSCVNPDHLFLGTHADNMHDMFAKGRARPRGKVPRTVAA